MFRNSLYHEVNREERHYCAILAHTLLSSPSTRKNFTDLVKQKFKLDFAPDDLEIYIEAAILRDYWKDLGDPRRYLETTHIQRRKIIELIMNHYGPASYNLDEISLFWTRGNPRKLWSPGRWSTPALKEKGWDKLLKVKWAFNAKPDLLLISGNTILVVEAKVESIEGSYDGATQLGIQKLIARLINQLIPAYKKAKIKTTFLSLHNPKGITWKEILNMMNEKELDAFTIKTMQQLKKYYQEKEK